MTLRRWAPRKLKSQMLVYGALATLIATTVMGSLNFVISENDASRETRDHMLEHATALQSVLTRTDPQQTQEILDAFSQGVDSSKVREILLVDSQGLVIASSHRESIGKMVEEATQEPEPTMRQVLAGQLAQSERQSTHRGIRIFELTLPLYADPTEPTRVTGALHYAEPYTAYDNLLRQILFQYIISDLLLTALLIAPLWLFFERRILRPVRRIDSANRALTAGQREASLIPSTEMPGNEIGDIMRSRHEMLTRLESAEAGLRHRLKELAALNATAALQSQSLKTDQFLQRILDKVIEITDSDAGELNLMDAATGQLTLGIRRGWSNDIWDEKNDPQTCVCASVCQGDDPICMLRSDDPSAQHPVCVRENVNLSCIIPLRAEGETLGVISLHHYEMRAHTQPEQDLLSAIGSQISVALSNIHFYQETQRLSLTDALTQLHNRRALEEQLQEELLRSQRYQHPLSVIMADIDHFKKHNDTHGHPQGDVILQQIAKLLQAQVRETDFVARYGGEEFIILLPETPKAEGISVAEKIRAAVANQVFPHEETQPGGKLTISLGVATFPADLLEPHDLIQKADDALYRAKEAGRNRVGKV